MPRAWFRGEIWTPADWARLATIPDPFRKTDNDLRSLFPGHQPHRVRLFWWSWRANTIQPSGYDDVRSLSRSVSALSLQTSRTGSASSRHPSITPQPLRNNLAGRGDATLAAPNNIQGQGQHVCGECGRRFTRPFNLAQHIRAHDNDRSFSCDREDIRNPRIQCPRAFVRNNDLQRHIRTVHDRERVTCHICQRTFARNDRLIQHMRQHHQEALEDQNQTSHGRGRRGGRGGGRRRGAAHLRLGFPSR